MMHRCLLVFFWVLAFGIQNVNADPLQEALAMFESGAVDTRTCAADKRRGASGEVSRYQILPSVWRQYTRAAQYDNPALAWSVAQRIIRDRTAWFQAKTGREPSSVEIYLLWNKPGHFSAVSFKIGRVSSIYRKRAERFANLCGALEARQKNTLASALAPIANSTKPIN
jgi:hypothetical protein